MHANEIKMKYFNLWESVHLETYYKMVFFFKLNYLLFADVILIFVLDLFQITLLLIF